MNTPETGYELISHFIGKEVVITLKRELYSGSRTMGGTPYIKCKILKVQAKFILIQYKNKEMVLNMDNILSIE